MKEKRTWEKILFLIRPYKLYVLCSLLCALLSVTASLLIPVFTGNVIDTFAAVSYTHLDVYKRQSLVRQRNWLRNMA